jgi:superfamily II DNA or RNA helicase
MSNFITNEPNKDLKKRLEELISGSYELKILVGYFYFSGWQEIYESLQKNSKIKLKILVGLQVDKYLSNGIIEVEHNDNLSQNELFNNFMRSLDIAMNDDDMDNNIFYQQLKFFLKLIVEDRLMIRKTYKPNHAKLYLFKLYKNLFNIQGEFITGSSNLTKAGLKSQNEFNIEVRDYGFTEAENYFDELWEESIKITENDIRKKELINFLKNDTQATEITPYEAYAYILKTYLDANKQIKDNLNINNILENSGFEKYQYQIDAVNQALQILKTYDGVIIADVVGLGKSIIASLIAVKLNQRGLIICPPRLIPNWEEYKKKFKLYLDIESAGKIDTIYDYDYKVIIVDEAHKFRNQDTDSYEALSVLCKGKKVILLTATPLNNSPLDIISLLKLFNGLPKITFEEKPENKFKEYDKELKNKKSTKKLAIANEIREIISPVIIRRNRLDLAQDFEYRKEMQNSSVFADPNELFYQLNAKQNKFYDDIIGNCFGKKGEFSGAIYRPFAYEDSKEDKNSWVLQQQSNLFDFMRRLLIKRFESSFGAFSQSINNFLTTHEKVKEFIQISNKYILDRKVINSIYDENGTLTLEAIEKTLSNFDELANDKEKIYYVDNFKHKDQFLTDIDNDIKLLKRIQKEIAKLKLVENDPKRAEILAEVKRQLNKDAKRKIIIFTEYVDTVKHLAKYFNDNLGDRVLISKGQQNIQSFSEILNQNFDASSDIQVNDYDVLITSDVLSEGVNLNRAGTVINYDIPWNPTRVIQRMGRINRISKKVFDELYIYNCFPTEKGSEHVKIKEIAERKMALIHHALGEDAKIFNADENPTGSDLFTKINEKPEINEKLNLITRVRNEYNDIKTKYPAVIARIEKLPHRIKTAKNHNDNGTMILRKKGLAIFVIFSDKQGKIVKKPFGELLNTVKCSYDEKRLDLSENFWQVYPKLKYHKFSNNFKNNSNSINKKAINRLKYLQKMENLSKDLDKFIAILLDDLQNYKTLPTITVRNLTKAGVTEIEELQTKLGSNYLQKSLQNIKNIKNEIIIAVELRNE